MEGHREGPSEVHEESRKRCGGVLAEAFTGAESRDEGGEGGRNQ